MNTKVALDDRARDLVRYRSQFGRLSGHPVELERAGALGCAVFLGSRLAELDMIDE